MRRSLDIVIAAVVVIVTAPVWVAVYLCVKSTSPGPALFKSTRIGLGGEQFTILKFRTMRDREHGAHVTAGDDPRITRVGRLLRKWKIDELPQMINVLRGDMGIVGPRPEDPRFVARYTAEQRLVLAVRPGLVSPAVLLNLDEEAELASATECGYEAESYYIDHVMPRKLEADLQYVNSRSLLGDLRLIFELSSTLICRVFRRVSPESP